MAFNDIDIKIGADFTGQPAFKEAAKSTDALNASVTSLGKKLAATFSIYKIAQFSKASVKAFMADEQAAKQLANQLRNIGYGEAVAGAEQFISAMQDQTGLLDDVLRPAYTQLARVTGDLGQTQKLLKTAWNTSSGSGEDFSKVVDVLSQAYVGNTKGLKSLNIGLTNAEAQTKTFSEVIDILNNKFAGAGQASLNTYAGAVALLSSHVQTGMETIGKAFIDGFAIINGDQGISGTSDNIDSLSDKLSDFIRLAFATAGVIQAALNPKNWFNKERQNAQIDAILKEYRLRQSLAEQGRRFKEWIPDSPWTKEQKDAAAKAAANAKKLADLIKKQTAAQAELNKKKKEATALDALSLKYKQAESIFDMDKIELAAAAMSRQSAEDYARIKLKRDLITLQEAIQSGDLAAAEAAAKIVDEDYKRVQAYQAQNILLGIQQGKIVNVGDAAKLIPTDLKLIDLNNLDAALAAIKKILDELAKINTTTVNKVTTGSSGGGKPSLVNPDGTLTPRGKNNLPPVEDTPMETWLATVNDAVKVLNANTNALKPLIDSGFFDLAYNAAEFSGVNMNPYQLTDAQAAAYNSAQTATITIVDNTSGLISIVTDATQQATANGINTRLVRNTGNLSW